MESSEVRDLLLPLTEKHAALDDSENSMSKLDYTNLACKILIPKCSGCDDFVFDELVFRISSHLWHAACLKCVVCCQRLSEKCFIKDGLLYCEDDINQIPESRCSGCDLELADDVYVRRACGYVFHTDCFQCILCGAKFETGDEFYLTKDGNLTCKYDYENLQFDEAEIRQGKRSRTLISVQQAEMLRFAYTLNPKPTRKQREQLSRETGLVMRVVQVWFQNRRAKERRMKARNTFNSGNLQGESSGEIKTFVNDTELSSTSSDSNL